MNSPENQDYELISGIGNSPLAEKVGEILGKPVDVQNKKFGDGEFNIQLKSNLRGRDVVIFQSTGGARVNDAYVQLQLLCDAAVRASAKEVSVVMPYMGYSRQDRKDKPRTPISSAAMVQTLESLGMKRLMTVHLHVEQEQGFIKGPWDNLPGAHVFIPEIAALGLENLQIASTDFGGVKGSKKIASRLQAGVVITDKDRNLFNGEHHSMGFLGDVSNSNVVIFDDEWASGGSAIDAANLFYKAGAKTVRAAITHGKFLGDWKKRLDDSPITQLYVSDTIEHSDEVVNHPRIKIVSTAPMLAEAIRRNQTGDSLGEVFFLG